MFQKTKQPVSYTHLDVYKRQVYAKIINKKKDEAVNLVNGLFH